MKDPAIPSTSVSIALQGVDTAPAPVLLPCTRYSVNTVLFSQVPCCSSSGSGSRRAHSRARNRSRLSGRFRGTGLSPSDLLLFNAACLPQQGCYGRTPRPMLPMWGLQVRPQNGQGFPERAKSSEKRRTKKEARKPSSAAGACGSRRCRSTEAEVQAHTDEPSGIRIRPKKTPGTNPRKAHPPLLAPEGPSLPISRRLSVCSFFLGGHSSPDRSRAHIPLSPGGSPVPTGSDKDKLWSDRGQPGYFGTSASHQKLVPSCV